MELITLLSLSGLLFAPASPPSQEDLDRLLDYDIDQLMHVEVTTGARRAEPLGETPANVVVITAEEIAERGYLTLTDIINDLPGFELQTGQPAGEYPTHYVFRGVAEVGQSSVHLMIDGVITNDVSNGWSHHMGFDMHLSDVARVEIVTGASSALYGPNAYAGLINIVTKNAAAHKDIAVGSLRSDVRMLLGSHRTFAPELLLAYRSEGDLFLQLSARHYNSLGDGGIDRADPGFYFHNNREPTQVLTTEYGLIANETGADGLTHPLDDGFKTDIADTSVRLKITKGDFNLGLNAWERKEGLGSEIVGYEYFAASDAHIYQAHHGGYTGHLTYGFSFGNGHRSQSRLSVHHTQVFPDTAFVYTYKYQSIDNGIDPPVADKPKNYNSRGFAMKFDQLVELRLLEDAGRQNTLVLGLQAEHRVEQYFGIGLGAFQDPSSTVVESTFEDETPSVQPVFYRKRLGFFAQDQQHIGADYILTAGVRLDTESAMQPMLTPRVALVGRPTEALVFKLLYGQAYMMPTTFQLYDEWRGNEALAPQRIRTGELEVRYQWRSYAAIKFNAFGSRLKNLITERPNPDPAARPIGPNGEHQTYFQNKGRGAVLGFNIGGDFKLHAMLKGFANYTFTTNDSGKPIAHVARHKINLGLHAQPHRHLALGLRLNWRGPTKAPKTNLYFHPKDPAFVAANYDYETYPGADGYAPAYTPVNLTVGGTQLKLGPVRFEPQLLVRNLFNTKYVTLGRQAGSGVRPIDQPNVQNPQGFIPPYHPQATREILLMMRFMH